MEIPIGGPILAIGGERRGLSVAQLLADLPKDADGYPGGRVRSSSDGDATPGDAVSAVNVSYERPNGSGFLPKVDVSILDLIDAPATLANEKTQISNESWAGHYAGSNGITATDATISGDISAQMLEGLREGPMLRMVIEDQTAVMLRLSSGLPSSNDVSMDDLAEVFDAIRLAHLTTAPGYDEAGSPSVPQWAAADVARQAAEEAERIGARQPEDELAFSSTPLRACDEILPPTEVARILPASRARAIPTPGVEREGVSYNRRYEADGVNDSIIRRVSRFTRSEQAKAALQVARDFENRTALQPIEGLNGVRYTDTLDAGMHIANFAVGVDFVELKTTTGLGNEPDITPAQLDALTSIVATRIEE